MWRLFAGHFVPAPLKNISVNAHFMLSVIIILHCAWVWRLHASNRRKTTFDNLTSNQVGLPAELKHINKRRKRN